LIINVDEKLTIDFDELIVELLTFALGLKIINE